MLHKIAVIAAVSGAAWAQSSLIPDGISDGCRTFLTQLNSNSDLLSCTQNLVKATANYGPGGNATSTSASAMGSALTNICSSSTSCDESKVRSALSSFGSSCTAELTSNKNDVVLRTYDVLYALIPMRNAVCSKDDSGKWCVIQIGSSSSPTTASVALANNAVDTSHKVDAAAIQEFLWTKDASALSKRDDAIYPNSTTFANNNVPFLTIQKDASYAQLCTTCTRNVLTSYINFESTLPYQPGLASSPLLNEQTDLYNGIKSTCGPSFLQGAVAAAGSLSDGSSDKNGASTLRFDAQALFAVVLGAATMTVFAFF
ncbi:hypothetical protein D9758_006568 [Tetrapyrgos nigripes]|uniref:DUF7729 domain-containing protein n=1 Tax=Tetrapyrgos nigripes TaxID=182062 RepID=A0A8H5GKF4_9AGAR|nr:hypothetical protein D9758_006568 [Tetrapyrgos nigripes]